MSTIEPKVGDSSPWDRIDNVEKLADGILFVGTAGHGGIWLSPERIAQIPPELRNPKSGYCTKPVWWEEDCEAGFPLFFFGALFHREVHRRVHRDQLVKMLDFFGPAWIASLNELRLTPVCATCRNNDIVRDASARWDDETQSWDLSDTHDNTTCEHCDSDCHVFEVPTVALRGAIDEAQHVRFDPRTGERVFYQDAADASEHRLRLMEDGFGTQMEHDDER